MEQKYYSIDHKQYIGIDRYGYHALTNDEIDVVKTEELSKRLQRINQRLEQLDYLKSVNYKRYNEKEYRKLQSQKEWIENKLSLMYGKTN